MDMRNEETDEELEEIRKRKLAALKFQMSHQEIPKSDFDTGGKVYILSALNFWELVQKYEKVVVECYASWCRPCKALEPILQRLANTHRKILFAKLDYDQSAVIADQFQVQGVPTILFFKEAKLVDRTAGALPISEMEAHIRRFLT